MSPVLRRLLMMLLKNPSSVAFVGTSLMMNVVLSPIATTIIAMDASPLSLILYVPNIAGVAIFVDIWT